MSIYFTKTTAKISGLCFKKVKNQIDFLIKMKHNESGMYAIIIDTTGTNVQNFKPVNSANAYCIRKKHFILTF